MRGGAASDAPFAAAAAARAHGSRFPVQLEPVATGQGGPRPSRRLRRAVLWPLRHLQFQGGSRAGRAPRPVTKLSPGWGPGGSTLPGERPALSWPLGLCPRPVPPPGALRGRKAWEAGGPRPVNPQTRSIRKERGPGSEWGKRKNQRTFGLWKRLERPGFGARRVRELRPRSLWP